MMRGILEVFWHKLHGHEVELEEFWSNKLNEIYRKDFFCWRCHQTLLIIKDKIEESEYFWDDPLMISFRNEKYGIPNSYNTSSIH